MLFQHIAIGTGERMAAAQVKEFLLRKITHHINNPDSVSPKELRSGAERLLSDEGFRVICGLLERGDYV